MLHHVWHMETTNSELHKVFACGISKVGIPGVVIYLPVPAVPAPKTGGQIARSRLEAPVNGTNRSELSCTIQPRNILLKPAVPSKVENSVDRMIDAAGTILAAFALEQNSENPTPASVVEKKHATH